MLVIDADGGVRQLPVRLGGSLDGLRIVEGGIRPDAQVVASTLTQIEPGAHVRAIEAATQPRP